MKRDDPKCLDVWPYLTLLIYPDGSVGARAIKSVANWEHVTEQAVEHLARLREQVEFIEQWAGAEHQREIEVRI